MASAKVTADARDAYEIRPLSKGVELIVGGELEGVFDDDAAARAYLSETQAKKPRKSRAVEARA